MKRVLVIEQNPVEARLLAEFLRGSEDASFEVTTVSGLSDGIGAVQSGRVDVVLVDLENGMGPETVLRLRDAAPDLVILVLTGIDDKAQAIEALQNGAQDYLIKATLNRQVLLRAIGYAIERKRVETERRIHDTQFLEGQKFEAIGIMARGLAHNLNNMLTAILGRSELVLESPDDTARDHVVAIKRCAERAAVLTRQLLTFSRKKNVALEAMNLNDVIAEMKVLLDSSAGADIMLGINPCVEHAIINGDRQQIGQLLMNLLINARTAMPKGGQCTIETASNGEQVLLVVSDTGCGIAAETLPHIFEPFFSTNTLALASGLGLSAVYGIVQQHGGTIEVVSAPGQGARFTIRFPLLGFAAA